MTKKNARKASKTSPAIDKKQKTMVSIKMIRVTIDNSLADIRNPFS